MLVSELLFSFNIYIIIIVLINNIQNIDYKIKFVFYLALIIRIYFSIFNRFIYSLPDAHLDANSYEAWGWYLSNQGFENMFNFSKGITWAYAHLISYIYVFTERAPLLIQSLNIFAGIASLFFLYKIVTLIFNDKKIAFYSCAIFAFYPTNILYNSIILKESIIGLLIVLSIYSFVLWYYKRKIIYIFLLCFFIFSNILFHSVIFLILFPLLFYVIFSLFSNFIRSLYNGVLKIQVSYIFLTLILLVVIFYTITKFQHIPYFSLFRGESSYDFNWLHLAIKFRFTGNTVYPLWLIPDNFFEFIYLTPVKIFYFLFTPFVWDISKPVYYFAFIDSMLFLFILFIIIFNIKNIFSNKLLLILLFVFIIELSLLAIGSGNFGTGVRHKNKLLSLAVLLCLPNVGIFMSIIIKNLRSSIIK